MRLTEKHALIFFDAEFTDLGLDGDILSVGLVAHETDDFYYAEVEEAVNGPVSDWVRDNVLPRLTGPVKPEEQVLTEMAAFIQDHAPGRMPILVGDCCAWDWVLLCKMAGGAFRIPEWFGNLYDFGMLDLSSLFFFLGLGDPRRVQFISDSPDLPRGEHNALFDARLAKCCYAVLDYHLNG